MTVRINYEEPEDRPIESVQWTCSVTTYKASMAKGGALQLHSRSPHIHSGAVPARDALEWARAVLKMVEQRHG